MHSPRREHFRGDRVEATDGGFLDARGALVAAVGEEGGGIVEAEGADAPDLGVETGANPGLWKPF